ncbi:MAG: hypothetical protein M5U28_04705 [Sandaracinaceae bacterium]|nr:hypothetical protein [Sandaracinaceae bacterium]
MGASAGPRALPRGWEERLGLRGAGRYGAALSTAEARGEVVGLPFAPKSAAARAEAALERGVRALLVEQAEDGSFESEIVSSPLLTAQHVLAWHAMTRPIEGRRRSGILLGFARAQRADGTWALHAAGPPDLPTTILVYVAARLLGLSKDDPLLSRAHAYIRGAGVPSRSRAGPRSGSRWSASTSGTPSAPAATPRSGGGRRDLRRASAETRPPSRTCAPGAHRPPPSARCATRSFVLPYDEIDFAARAAKRTAAGELAARARAWLERGRGAGPRTEVARRELRATSHAGASPRAPSSICSRSTPTTRTTPTRSAPSSASRRGSGTTRSRERACARHAARRGTPRSPRGRSRPCPIRSGQTT